MRRVLVAAAPPRQPPPAGTFGGARCRRCVRGPAARGAGRDRSGRRQRPEPCARGDAGNAAPAAVAAAARPCRHHRPARPGARLDRYRARAHRAAARPHRTGTGTTVVSGTLILASTSRYRRELLQRLQLPFTTERPEVDETALPGESPAALAARLAAAKAREVARVHPAAWVIGSDQVAGFDGRALGKPGTRDAAIAQLESMSGSSVQFLTAVALCRGGAVAGEALDVTTVVFRHLQRAEIERYVDAEQPLDCAGSFKSEGLGIALFEAIDTRDPTALVGLPLIATAGLLRNAGFVLP
ncbi:hypothetical protein CO641_02800 [Lysobacteraceae bacterium NML91-0213]|nr:hypothetical protein CO641_02800 [Xanthomonadaceae bacterium NML91-0213]